MKVDSLNAQLLSINKRKKALELRIEARQLKKLLALPAQAGMADMDILIIALIPLSSLMLREKMKAAGFTNSDNPAALLKGNNGKASGKTSLRRIQFTPELKSRIKAELETKRKSVAVLSREYGPSHASIMAWKRGWGMTQPRTKQ
jgi:hypothetical protein